MNCWNSVIQNRTVEHIPELSYRPAEDGSEIVWNHRLIPIIDPERDTRVRFVLVSAVEITEQVQARKELEEVDELKDEFLSLVTHELRTPLTTIQGNTQLLQRNLNQLAKRLGENAAQEQQIDHNLQMLNRIIHQVAQIDKLIGEMTDVTRIRGKIFSLQTSEKVDLITLVREVAEHYTMQGQDISLHTPDTDLLGTWDEDRIEQVLNNLINNAIKYSSPGKPITITVEARSQSMPEAVVAVHDEGMGISQEEQQYIFSRFYRTQSAKEEKVTDLGLGLYIAHEIVEQHGGQMWVESQKGKGSTFYISLPL